MAESDQVGDARRFDLLVRSVTDYAIYLLDLEGHVSSWNAGAEKIKGYAADEVIGRHFSCFYTEEDRVSGLPARALETARETGRFEGEGWRVRKDGRRFWAMVVVDAVHDDDGTLVGFAKITRDMTERREAAEQLEETRSQLYQLQKMEALGHLTGGLAHDFNNLLTAIISGANLIARNAGDQDKVERLAESIRAAADRGGGMIRQLLAFARRQPIETRRVDLHEQLSASATLLRHSLSPEIELVVELSDPLPETEVDPGQLELALLNLGFNARDAMPEGGEIRLAAHRVVLDGRVQGLVGDFAAITVSDTGQGIPLELKHRIVEPFFTTKPFGKGSGLGLSQVYGFAVQSKGALTVESEPGQGAAFTIYLPVLQENDTDGEKAGADVPLVLMVEDDPGVAALTKELLDELGYRVLVAHSGSEALRLLTSRPDVQVLFSDIVMPGGMTGMELAQRIRQRRPELPVLLTSGYSETAQAGCEFPLLSKPYHIDELESALAAVVHPSSSPRTFA